MSHRKPQIIMCRPTHFGVQYVINPWMQGQIGRARNEVASEQWNQLHQLLSDLTDVAVMEGVPALPDMCFTANAGLLIGNTFLPSRFRFPQREPESARFIQWFHDHGFDILPLDEDDPYEGEGDTLLAYDPQSEATPVLWSGYGMRTALESHGTLARRLPVEVVSLRLVDSRFYHLDTCFYPLPEGRVVYYPAAFDESSLIEIRRRVSADRRIEVAEADALRFTCNSIRIGSTLITNYASPELQQRLADWGYDVRVTPLDEFILAGGAAKCLCLMAQPEIDPRHEWRGEPIIRQTRIQVQGHLLDTGLMNRLFDTITEGGGSFRVEQFLVGHRHDQQSVATVRVTGPDSGRLDMILNGLQTLGAVAVMEPTDARLETAAQPGVAPQDFYSTTIYPTEVRVQGNWLRAARQRMDAVIVVEQDGDAMHARCSLIRDLKLGDRVVCGVDGVRVHPPVTRQRDTEFSFMSAGVSSERRVELAVEELAWEMRRMRERSRRAAQEGRRDGRIVVVAGPVVVHTGGSAHLAKLIRMGYVDALLTGNALPAHDIEMNFFGTSLGIDMARGVGVHGGHQHHIKAINRVRAAGSIRAAVEQGIVTGGVMYECVKHNVEFVLAGSIRDDGPLPDTLMDLLEAQAAYARAIENADMILMLSTMLHAIGVGNMTRAGVRLVCVDISPAVVTKLADRGSVESTGIVTDVGLFLNLLVRQLDSARD